MPDSTVMCRDQRTVTICFAQVTVKLRLFISIVTIVVSTSAIVLKAVLHISLVLPILQSLGVQIFYLMHDPSINNRNSLLVKV